MTWLVESSFAPHIFTVAGIINMVLVFLSFGWIGVFYRGFILLSLVIINIFTFIFHMSFFPGSNEIALAGLEAWLVSVLAVIFFFFRNDLT